MKIIAARAVKALLRESCRRNVRTTGDTNRRGRRAASRHDRNQIRIQSRLRSQRRLRIRRTKRTPAPTPDSKRDTPLPAPATMPNLRRRAASGHSDKAPSPTAHRKPKSNRNTAATPSDPRDKAPIPEQHSGPTLARNQEPSSIGRKDRDLANRCNSDSCCASLRNSSKALLRSLFQLSQSSRERACETLYCGLSVPAIVIIWPASTRVVPCGVEMSAEPRRITTCVSASEFTRMRNSPSPQRTDGRIRRVNF